MLSVILPTGLSPNGDKNTQLARLGGYLNRAGDGPPENTVIWRGLSHFTDIELGYLLGVQHVGN